jgi:hypothetical protein
MRNECLEAAKEVLAAVMIKPRIEKSGSHIKVIWGAPGGGNRMVTVPFTFRGDNGHAVENTRARTRRLLREDGLDKLKPKPQEFSQVGISVTINGKTPTGRIRIPLAMLALLGNPERVKITGTPFEGWILVGGNSVFDGVKLFGGENAQNRWTSFSIGAEISRMARANVDVTCRFDRGANCIRISGPPQDWIAGVALWVKLQAPQAVPPPPVIEQPPPPQARTEPACTPAVVATRARIDAKLNEIRQECKLLSRATGLDIVLRASLVIK